MTYYTENHTVRIKDPYGCFTGRTYQYTTYKEKIAYNKAYYADLSYKEVIGVHVFILGLAGIIYLYKVYIKK